MVSPAVKQSVSTRELYVKLDIHFELVSATADKSAGINFGCSLQSGGICSKRWLNDLLCC